MSTFRPGCKHTTRGVKRSSGSGKNKTHIDHNTSNSLALTNRFHVLQKMSADSENLTHENANAECSTPCDNVPGQPKISDNDQVGLTKKARKYMSCSLLQQTSKLNTGSDGGDTLNRELLGAFEKFTLERGDEHSSEMVTRENLLKRTQCGFKNSQMSNTEHSVQLENAIKEEMNMAENLDLYLPYLDNDLTLDPGVENHFSKSFLANTEVPPLIRQQCQYSRDFRLSKIQNGHDFGFIPLTDVKTYEGPPITWNKPIDILEAHSIICNSGVPNFLKCRITFQTQLRPKVWAQKLKDYWDQQLPDLIAFGFPLDFDRANRLTPTLENHASAKEHIQHIDQYIKEELTYGALYGPYESVPFQVHISPLMTSEKQNSDKRRTIVDLSWPKGHSVNAGVQKNSYLGAYFDLKYPSIDHVVKKLKILGTGALLYKVDISRAFHHLRIDPGDIDLLGIYHNNLFLDGSLPFGFRLGSRFFEKCSDAIRYMMSQAGHNGLMNYIDDLLYVGPPSTIWDSYHDLLQLLQDLGLEVSQSKLVPPSTQVICLGILVDSVNKTLSIPEDKLKDIIDMVHKWQDKTTCTKTQFQPLLGSLLYITKCVHPAHYFLNRMLVILRNNAFHFSLSPSFFKDLNWFHQFLKHFNGVTYFENRKVQAEIHLDASLAGLGACYNNMVYTLPLPQSFNQ